jgi:hypothetical protein
LGLANRNQRKDKHLHQTKFAAKRRDPMSSHAANCHFAPHRRCPHANLTGWGILTMGNNRHVITDKQRRVLKRKWLLHKLPRKRKSLTVQGDFDKIIDVGRTQSCFLTVSKGKSQFL